MTLGQVSFSLASFVHELALAWQKLAIYQDGHPAREQAVGRAHAVLVGLIAPTGGLSLGVARDALIGPEERLVSSAAQRFAQALYLCEVAVVRFQEGVLPEELEALLTLLPRGTIANDDRAFDERMEESGIRYIRADPVDFTDLVATDSLDDTVDRIGRESLWESILQRLLSDERLEAVGAVLQSERGGSLEEVVQAIQQTFDRHVKGGSSGRGEADEVLRALSDGVGVSIGDQLVEDGPPEDRRSALRHVTELLGALPESLREGALDAAVRDLVVEDERQEGLRSLSGTLSAAEMVGALRRLRTERVSFSPRSVSLVESLVVEASGEWSPWGVEAEGGDLTQELEELFGEHDADRVPGSMTDDRLFLELRRHVPIHARFADLDPYLATLTESRLTVDLSRTLEELLARPLFDDDQVRGLIERQRETFGMIVASGRFVTAIRIVESLTAQAEDLEATRPLRLAAQKCLEALRGEETLVLLIDRLGDSKKETLSSLYRLAAALGPDAISGLLGLLAEEDDLSRRRHTFDLLVGLGPGVHSLASALLDDSRWYMVRNMLSLLRQLALGIEADDLEKGLGHEDARVRLEAVKCLSELEVPPSPDRVKRLLEDEDPRIAESTVAVLGSARISTAIDPLAELLSRPDPLGRNRPIRLKALAALAEIGDASVLPKIASYFRPWFSPISTEVRRVAFDSLRHYPPSEIQGWLDKGRRATDARIREICRELSSRGG